MRLAIVFLLMIGVGCTKTNPDYCDKDLDCGDAKPFCDLNGEYVESGHTKHTCTVEPQGCPVERCGCTPGEGISCSGDELTSCAGDGRSTNRATCALGCSDARCLTFDPANDLASALEQAASAPDLALPPGATADTTSGNVKDSGGNTIQVTSVLVPGPNSTMLRAYLGRSIDIQGLTITGTYPVALLAPGPITVRGPLDASANAISAGPGAKDSPDACVPPHVYGPTCAPLINECYDGAGGGGNVTAGGAGGGETTAGGAPGAAFTPSGLAGGCRGGSQGDFGGGGGGGGVQVSSLVSIVLTNTGVINVGGGGGANGSGGGSGGNMILEAPVIRIDGLTAGIAANGGAGGGCGMPGQDGGTTIYSAVGPQCGSLSAGYGASGNSPPTSGSVCTSSCPTIDYRYGGGGGAVGRARLATRDGTVQVVGDPVMSASVTLIALTTR